MTFDQTVDSPQYNVRAWFKSLSSGRDRAAAIAITDEDFITMFLDVACSSPIDNNVLEFQQGSDMIAHLETDPGSSRISKELAAASLESLSLVEKLSLDSKTGTIGKTDTPSRVVNSERYTYDCMTPDLDLDIDNVEQKQPSGKVPSTTFKIRSKNLQDTEKTEPCNKMQDRALLTTLHFDSGLTLPISSTSDTNKIAVANSALKISSNIRGSKFESLPVRPNLVDLGTPIQPGDNVHQKLNFSALNISTTPLLECRTFPSSGTLGDKKKKQKELISRSKLSASRAMLPTLPAIDRETVNTKAELLRHVRLVFTSALAVVEKTLTNGENPVKEGIEILTLDPCYLQNESEVGLKFFNDAQRIIDSQYSKHKQPGQSTDECTKSRQFLNNRVIIDEETTRTKVSWPEWLLPVVESKDPSIHLLLILLAKVELSIQQSHQQYIKAFQVGNSINESLRQTYSLSPHIKLNPASLFTVNEKVYAASNSLSSSQISYSLIKEDDTVHSSPVQEVTETVPCLDLMYRKKIMPLYTSSHKISTSVGRHFQNILKTWAKLNSEKDCTNLVKAKIKELLWSDKSVDGNEYNAKDLVLVPLPLVISSNSTHVFHEPCQDIQHLGKKWNDIILSGLSHVQQTMLSDSKDKVTCDVIEEAKIVDTVDGILEDDASFLFKNESLKVSSGKKKKKKKKRRKRKLALACRDATADTCQDNGLVVGGSDAGGDEVTNLSKQNTIFKVVCELNNDINVLRKAVSLQTPVTRAINNCEEKLTEKKINATHIKSNGDITTLNTDLTVSLVNGVNGTCVVGGGRLEEDELEDSDAWETVEPKGGRGSSRKRTFPDAHSTNCQTLGTGRKNKPKAKGPSRQRSSQRRKAKDGTKEVSKDSVKVIEDIMLESVDEEIEKRQKAISNVQKKERSSKHGEKSNKQRGSANLLPNGMSPGRNARAASCRDVVMGHIASNPPVRIPSLRIVEGSSDQILSTNSSTNLKLRHGCQTNVRKKESNAKLKGQKKRSMLSADQNTATTVPDTISGLSAATPSTSNTDEHDTQFVRRGTSGIKGTAVSNNKSKVIIRNNDRGFDSSSVSGTGDMRVGKSEKKVSKSTAPLLQTVIGPRDVDSTKSSVASSLEATKEDDVGYHLLKSCEKLSDDMVTFMDRRALALSVKRRERNLLLAALQEILQSIWAGQCRPEIYGSCATKLDLPSSDLDVVIRELDLKDEDGSLSRKASMHQNSESSKEVYVTEMDTKISDELLDSPSHINSYQRHHHFYPPLSKNGLRVMRLATELETQPWAVQVNPIPTASVPVLKILADPSRLPGATAGMDWIVHHQHMAAAVAAEMNSARSIQQKDQVSGAQTNDQADFCRRPASHLAAMSGMSSPPYHTAPAPWRGADAMNGLLSLDITFEGTEHGGLGSTEYTNRVVDESCRETGLPPESTPAVQVLVVIKELLAQRRLNEPFSGGLSSYAILLLVVAVMKERRRIKQEMDRVERQRRAVAFESNTSITGMQPQPCHEKKKPFMWPTPKQQSLFSSGLPTDKGSTKGYTKRETVKTETSNTRKSSWAAIAKKSVTAHNVTEKLSTFNTCCKKDTRESATDPSANFGNSTTKENAFSVIGIKKECIPPETAAEIKSDPTDMHDTPLFPQGSNDVLEVLCSGETTAGKLLMHFLLFYGRHFDAQTTCIDLGMNNGLKMRERESLNELSPFRPRKTGGFYNPVTEVYTVDPVVVYDPWEESESNMNVARSCFAWGNIRCVFEQCFNTLSGVVERGNGTGSSDRNGFRNNGSDKSTCASRLLNGEESSLPGVPSASIGRHHDTDNVSPLLELLLSF